MKKKNKAGDITFSDYILHNYSNQLKQYGTAIKIDT